MKMEQPMRGLSPQQKQQAEQAFSAAVQRAKSGDYGAAAELYRRAAAYGHPGAENNLGVQYRDGRGVSRNPGEAFALFLRSAQHGNVYGMRNAASCYLKGVGTKADFDAAVLWLKAAAEQKDSRACTMLGELYGTGLHRDEEQFLYWHRRGAEYGSADSMFQLGNFWLKRQSGQDLAQAVRYFDGAAECGTPAMQLKVANVFDVPNGGGEPLDLERAKQWYIQVLGCEDPKLRLEAAKALDERTSWDGSQKRPALDAARAYAAYRMLASAGNQEACRCAAYCSELGRGTPANLDVAIMLYERGGSPERAAWCRKKKAGALQDSAFERHKDYCMPEARPNLHSQGKERYNVDFDSDKCSYNGRIYYINDSLFSASYVCSSDCQGGDIQVLCEEEGPFLSIHVNITGIYVYRISEDELYVRHLDFDGTTIRQLQKKFPGRQLGSAYFYDNTLYFACNPVSERETASLQCIQIDRDEGTVLYERASFITRVLATSRVLVFHASYRNALDEELEESGWMMFHLTSHTVESLSHPHCSPENVVLHPEVYDEDSPAYIPQHRASRPIVFFDFERGIAWTVRTELEGKDSGHLRQVQYWEPRNLFGNRDEVIPDLPIWRVPDRINEKERAYFDGTYCFAASSYFKFHSYDRTGTSYNWSSDNGGHGNCHRFVVLAPYLFLDVAAFREEQYELSRDPVKPIRKTWFQDKLSPEPAEGRKPKHLEGTPAVEKTAWESQEPVFSFAVEELPELPIEPEQGKRTSGEAEQLRNGQSLCDLEVEKKLGSTDIKYNICTFGAKFHIGFGVPVTIQIDGKSYTCKTHNSAKGRIDGLKALYQENHLGLGDVLKARYIASEDLIVLERKE